MLVQAKFKSNHSSQQFLTCIHSPKTCSPTLYCSSVCSISRCSSNPSSNFNMVQRKNNRLWATCSCSRDRVFRAKSIVYSMDLEICRGQSILSPRSMIRKVLLIWPLCSQTLIKLFIGWDQVLCSYKQAISSSFSNSSCNSKLWWFSLQ